MSDLKIGSMFSGYGGLDIAVERVFGARPAWVADIDEAPSKVLAHHLPDVPNLGDVTKVSWSTLERVDILTGGSPCQDISAAGRKAGMTEGTRSNLWVNMREAVDVLRPTFVVWENVQGALSTKAFSEADRREGDQHSLSDVESRDGLLGNGYGRYLRALGRVLGDLAEIGYDAKWTTLRASDIGAPHHRARVFVLAYASGERLQEGGWPSGGQAENSWSDFGEDALPDPEGDGRARQHDSSGGPEARRVWIRDTAGGAGSSDVPDSECSGWGGGRLQPGGSSEARTAGDSAGCHTHDTDWGDYVEAVRRWERIVGAAPAPTELSSRGNPRLAPEFVEWMMGLPRGHVTSPEIGLSRRQQLQVLGNGVVPQQAEAAIRRLAGAS